MAKHLPIQSDSIAFYQMNQETGDEPDAVNGYTMTEAGTVPAVADSPFSDQPSSRDLSSSDSNKFANTPDVAAFKGLDALTVAAWVKQDEIWTTLVYGTVWALWNAGVVQSFGIRDNDRVSSNRLFADIACAGTSATLLGTTPLTSLSEWMLIAVTWERDVGGWLLVNGVVDAEDLATAGAMQSNGTSVGIGKTYTTSRRFPGYVAELHVYGSRKSAEWLLDIYTGTDEEPVSGPYQLITDGKDYQAVNGKLQRDKTIASRCRARLCTRRGSWLGDLSMGSRLHELTITKNAEELAMIYIREALEPLRQAGEIANINPLEFFLDQPNGSLGVSVEVVLPSSEIVPLGVIPIGV